MLRPGLARARPWEAGGAEQSLERIGAGHFPHNPASGRVLEKAGLEREGVLRGFVRKGGRRLDLVVFGVCTEPEPTPHRS